MVLSPQCSLRLDAHNSLKNLAVVETDGNHGPKDRPSVLPCIQSSMSDVQVLDLKSARQSNLSEKDEYTVRYARKSENENN